jgi:hypothetical protein
MQKSLRIENESRRTSERLAENPRDGSLQQWGSQSHLTPGLWAAFATTSGWAVTRLPAWATPGRNNLGAPPSCLPGPGTGERSISWWTDGERGPDSPRGPPGSIPSNPSRCAVLLPEERVVASADHLLELVSDSAPHHGRESSA